MQIVSESSFQQYSDTIKNLQSPMGDRINALFCLRTLSNMESIDCLIDTFKIEKDSELLRHEICYCLG